LKPLIIILALFSLGLLQYIHSVRTARRLMSRRRGRSE
jgi:hypothetical protein